MSIKDYRRKLTQQVNDERARTAAPTWGPELESHGAPDLLGPAAGGAADQAKVASLAAPDGHSDPRLRAVALGTAAAAASPDTAHELPLQRLADKAENWQVRLAALRILKQLSFSSPTAAAWRPQYTEALRSALDVPELRQPAFSSLTRLGDRKAQELLTEGLRDPSKALVSVAEALNLLANDPHTDVADIARQVADSPPDDAALEAALRHLTSDPDSVQRLQSLVADAARPIAIRKLAATALNALSPESLQEQPTLTLEASPNDSLQEHIRGLVRRRPQQ